MANGEQRPVLTAEAIRKTYGRRDAPALVDVTVSLLPGERLVLLGPSGSGKSTLLNVLAGFIEPDRGRVVIDGQDATGDPPNRRNLGMVFQSHALFPHMTVQQNLAFGLKARRVPAAERGERIERALELVGLAGFERRRPNQLSGGQQQRVAFARALVTRPSVLLLDEPFASLDTALRRDLRTQLTALQEELGISTILVTHDQEEALAFGHRVAVLRDGHLEQVASPEDLYQSPVSPFVAQFLGNCTQLDARVDRVDDTHVIATVAGTSTRLAIPRSRCQAGGPLDVGRSLSVIVRPEWLVLHDNGQHSEDCDQTIDGTLVRRVFLGDQIEYVVRVADVELTARTQAPDLLAARVGEQVTLCTRRSAPLQAFGDGAAAPSSGARDMSGANAS